MRCKLRFLREVSDSFSPVGEKAGMRGDSVAMMDAFVPVSRPLTLTLSPEGEREQPLDVFLKFISQRAAAAVSYAMKRQRALAKELGAILPLRWERAG